MKFVSKILIVIFLFVFAQVNAQSTSARLKNEQNKLEKNIAKTKALLEKAQSNTSNSLNQLKLLNNQITYREQLLRNYDNQIRGAELKIKSKQQQVEELNTQIKQLKDQYKNLLLYAYKNRNKYGKMMFVFSSESYFQAIKRAKYLEKIQALIQKQFLLIKQHQKLILSEVENIQQEKKRKIAFLADKKQERDQILKDKEEQKQVYNELQKQEASIKANLIVKEKERAELKRKIEAAIRKEIAAERARREAEARKNAATNKKATVPNKPEKESNSSVLLPETKESMALSTSFANNRGKLPWPVLRGNITEGYGKNSHPTLPGVYTQNNGVDISAPKHAQVRAIFEGEVTSIMNIPGSGKVIILKHGNYRTVYSNLENTFVKTGDKVSTKKVIGSLTATNKQSLSILHFEMHLVSGSSVSSVNPSLWLSK